MFKFLYDFLPIIIFFGTYKLTDNDIYAATTAAIIATLIHSAIQWIMHKKLEKQHIINLVVILLFGSLTLIFHDDTFIKWKVTVINWIFALILFGSQFIGKKNIIQRQLEEAIKLGCENPDEAYVNIALAKRALGLNGDARKYAMSTLELDPENEIAKMIVRQVDVTGEHFGSD